MGKSAEQDQLVAYVRARVAGEPAYAYYVFCVIWERQQPREKYYGTYQGSDGRGFWEGDTPFFCRLYNDIEDRGYKPTYGQARILQERIGRYARQYVRDCEERGVSVHSRGPKPPGDVQPAKVNKHPAKQKGDLSDKQREQIMANVEALTALPGS